MICGNRTFIPELGQHRFCTLLIGLSTNPNHDMPNPDNKIKPHRSGEWTWATPYSAIGPVLDCGMFYKEDARMLKVEESLFQEDVSDVPG